jgi:pSer/pThr/pTyr-binding forkhead associated (FHA) protein
MAGSDFSTWYSVGAYGGFVCALAATAAVALVALLGRRGAPRQAVAAVLACVAAVVLTLPGIWWDLNRLEVYGPLLAGGEVTFWLAWTATFGWVLPLAVLALFWTFASAAGAQGSVAAVGAVPRTSDVPLASLADPARRIEPRGPGRAWGHLVALGGPYAGRASPLSRQLTLLGREADNDIVLDDERSSRHHAEIRWDHGHVQLVDRLSTNGTLLNGQLVRGAMSLRPGDVIDLAGQRYRFELLDDGSSAMLLPVEVSETQKIPGVPTVSLVFEGIPLMLVALNGAGAVERWLLQAGITTIGRDAEREVQLRHSSVSRLHAQIVRQRTGYFVQDLQSSNGTWLNGQPLTAPAMLSPGDVLRVGEVELRCEMVPEVVSTPPPVSAAAPRPSARSAVTVPPRGSLPPGVVANRHAPISRTSARLGPPRLTPSDPPAPDQPPQP